MAQLINGPKRWKQFVKSSLYDLQDPTFLTFDLDFYLDSPDTSSVEDGLYWDGLFRDPHIADETLNVIYDQVEWSAVDWLMKYGSTSTLLAATNLVMAKIKLKELQQAPWYFQSIVGIDSLWKALSRVKEGDKKAEITINCIDSIQQPLLQFAEYYRKAIYDQQRLSYTLPDNLRTFNMSITLYEIRDIKDDYGRLTNGLHQLRFKLRKCEFDFDQFLSSPSISEFKAFTSEQSFATSFKIKVGWVEEESESSIESDYHSLGIFSGIANSLEGRAQRFLSSIVSLPARVIGDITNQIQTSLENIIGQNVYDRSTEVISTNSLFGRTSPVGPNISSLIGDDVYPGKIKLPTVNNGDLGDVYP